MEVKTGRDWKLVSRVVAACKGESMRVDEFFCSALSAELPKWETKA